MSCPVGTHGEDSPCEIQQKLRLGSRSDLVRYALEHKLLMPDR